MENMNAWNAMPGGTLTMQYKLLALDIDGTLVNSEGKITPRVRQAIRNAVDAGCHVMLAGFIVE